MERAGVREQHVKIDNINEPLDVEGQRGRRGAAPLPAGRDDLGRGGLPPYDVGRRSGPARTKDVGGAGELTLPITNAVLDHRPQHALERREDADGAEGMPVRRGHERTDIMAEAAAAYPVARVTS